MQTSRVRMRLCAVGGRAAACMSVSGVCAQKTPRSAVVAGVSARAVHWAGTEPGFTPVHALLDTNYSRRVRRVIHWLPSWAAPCLSSLTNSVSNRGSWLYIEWESDCICERYYWADAKGAKR